jgi:dienelactone hydrolase
VKGFRAAAYVLVPALLAAASASARTSVSRVDGCTSTAGDVHFAAPDGISLVGHRFGTGRTAVVLVHQIDGNVCQWAPYARRLARLGYTALAIDLRGYGGSGAVSAYASDRYGGDVAAAAGWLRRHGAKKVFLLGASMGGSAVIDAAANMRQPVDAVVSVSGASDLSGALGAARRVRVPLLLLAGGADTEFAADARSMYRAAASDPARKLDIIASGSHGVDLIASSDEARDAVEGFFRTH